MEMTTNRYVFCNACSRCGNGFYGKNCGSVGDDASTVIPAVPVCGSGDIDLCPRCGCEESECVCGNGYGNSRCGCGCGNGCGNSRSNGCGCGNGCGNSRCGGCGCGNGCGNSRCGGYGCGC